MSRKLGFKVEREALKFLKKQGFVPVVQNFNCKVGEIDLIMKDQDSFVFVEVRYRSRSDYGSALESITYSKQQKLKKAAVYFLQKNSLYDKVYCRFDVVSVSDNLKLHWIRNAFQ